MSIEVFRKDNTPVTIEDVTNDILACNDFDDSPIYDDFWEKYKSNATNEDKTKFVFEVQDLVNVKLTGRYGLLVQKNLNIFGLI